MDKVSIIGLDLAKRSFQAHGALADGGIGFRKKLSREKVLGFFAEQPRCVAALEVCGSAHHWGRAIRDLGHEVRLIPPAYVKPFVSAPAKPAPFFHNIDPADGLHLLSVPLTPAVGEA